MKTVKTAHDRQFEVSTPAGKIRVCAKTPVDNPKDYPGIIVEVETENDPSPYIVACVEYDQLTKDLLLTGFTNPVSDEPSVAAHCYGKDWLKRMKEAYA